MKANTRSSSINAYQTIVQKIAPTQEQKILSILEQMGSSSRRQVAKALDMETSTVSARVNSLIKAGHIKETDMQVCLLSKRLVNYIEIV